MLKIASGHRPDIHLSPAALDLADVEAALHGKADAVAENPALLNAGDRLGVATRYRRHSVFNGLVQGCAPMFGKGTGARAQYARVNLHPGTFWSNGFRALHSFDEARAAGISLGRAAIAGA